MFFNNIDNLPYISDMILSLTCPNYCTILGTTSTSTERAVLVLERAVLVLLLELKKDLFFNTSSAQSSETTRNISNRVITIFRNQFVNSNDTASSL